MRALPPLLALMTSLPFLLAPPPAGAAPVPPDCGQSEAVLQQDFTDLYDLRCHFDLSASLPTYGMLFRAEFRTECPEDPSMGPFARRCTLSWCVKETPCTSDEFTPLYEFDVPPPCHDVRAEPTSGGGLRVTAAWPATGYVCAQVVVESVSCAREGAGTACTVTSCASLGETCAPQPQTLRAPVPWVPGCAPHLTFDGGSPAKPSTVQVWTNDSAGTCFQRGVFAPNPFSCFAIEGLDCSLPCFENGLLYIEVHGEVTLGGTAECGGAQTGCEIVGNPATVGCTAGPVPTQYRDVGVCRATQPGSTVFCWVRQTI